MLRPALNPALKNQGWWHFNQSRTTPLPPLRPAPVVRAPEPQQKSPGFWQRLQRNPQAAPTPKPAAAKPAAKPVPAPIAKPTPTPKPAPAATPAPPIVKPTPAPAATPAAVAPVAKGASYDQVREQALKDPQVSSLLQKMQVAEEGSASYKTAANAYVTALFAKMRKLDPSQEEAFSRKERAYKRLIEAGTPIME